MADWLIEPLAREHQRAEFTCGKGSLDAFLRNLASQYEKRRLGRTYVVVKPGETRVWGYYTLASGAVSFEHLPEEGTGKLPRHPVPVVLLGRLAVDQATRGQGLGRMLLVDAFRRCLALSTSLGIHAVEVDAIDEEAKAFYVKYGFVALQDDPHHLYLPMATIEEAFGGEGQKSG